MPWKVKKDKDQYCVVKDTGEVVHCHDTEGAAMAQMQALYANEPEAKSVKFAAGSETDIEGLLAPYNGPFSGKDIEGEFFSAKTDFVLDWFKADRPLLFQHGLDGEVGVSVVGRITEVKKMDAGLWMKAQLDAAHEYYGAIKELVKQGKLGLSSGSMRHLVRTDKSSGEILRWPLVEGSLTPTPANPLADVDFATAKSHYKAIGVDLPDGLKVLQEGDDTAGGYVAGDSNADDLAEKKAASGAEGEKMGMAAMREMMKKMAGDMDMDVSDAEMDKMLAKMDGGMPDEMAKQAMQKMLQAHKSIKAMRGSFEELQEKLQHLVNPQHPFECVDKYSYVQATFPDHAIVVRHCDGEATHWQVEYTINDDGDPVIGTVSEVEQAYVPAEAKAGPIILHADTIIRYAAAFAERTRDLRERRDKEGRIISTANRQRIKDCMDAMDACMTSLRDLYDGTEPQPAKAASVRRQFEMFELWATSLN